MSTGLPGEEMTLAELIRLADIYDRPVPRYTSYPTAVEFREGITSQDYRGLLTQAAVRPNEPLSLYLHVPFCAERCTYCACEVIPTHKASVAEDYLRRLLREAELVASGLGGRRRLKVVHLGGGTPTYLSPAQLVRLFDHLRSRFEIDPLAEISVEVDPRVTSHEHLEAMKASGVSRLSLGIQDFDQQVQVAIGRNQTTGQTLKLVADCRKIGFENLNFDLVYGLPEQTPDSMEETIDKVVVLRPDRIALYGYAHVPWMRPNQKTIRAESLPGPHRRLELFWLAQSHLRKAGYVAVGMDHFALPHDDLAVAYREQRLGRNFMGFTPHTDLEILGLGVSSIGFVAGAYVQNQKRLAAYYRTIDAGELPSERGVRTTQDDTVRRWTIHEILCHGRILKLAFENRFGVAFDSYFERELPNVAELEAEGLVRLAPGVIAATERGQFFLRNLALVFDRYRAQPDAAAQRFSRAV